MSNPESGESKTMKDTSMRIGIDCLACFMQQALTTVKLSTDDEVLRQKVLLGVTQLYNTFSMDLSSPENLIHLYQYISDMTGTVDPFAEIKKQSNDFALGLAPEIDQAIDQAPDSLLAAIQYAISGNVLDSGAQNQLDIHHALKECLNTPFDIDHYSRLKNKLARSRKVLFLSDNCGEIVLDKLLIRRLVDMGLDVTLAVRGMPAINDATMADAEYCGLDQVCRVISNGTAFAGTVIEKSSPEFREAYDAADCIVSKGMGNFESLSDVDAPIFFLFKIKCSTVLEYIRARHGAAPLEIGSPVVLSAR